MIHWFPFGPSQNDEVSGILLDTLRDAEVGGIFLEPLKHVGISYTPLDPLREVKMREVVCEEYNREHPQEATSSQSRLLFLQSIQGPALHSLHSSTLQSLEDSMSQRGPKTKTPFILSLWVLAMTPPHPCVSLGVGHTDPLPCIFVGSAIMPHLHVSPWGLTRATHFHVSLQLLISVAHLPVCL